MPSEEEAPTSLAPWSLEPAALQSPAEEANYQQLRQIRDQLRLAGMSEEAIQGWINRLQSISAIIEHGCRIYGLPGAGELLLDILGDLIHDITHMETTPTQEAGMSQAGSEERSAAEEHTGSDQS